MVSGFTRQETLALTGITEGRLIYLEKMNLIVPGKNGNPSHPKVFYSPEQVLELKIIDRLLDELSFRQRIDLINFFRLYNYRKDLFNCQIIAINDDVYVIDDWEEFARTLLDLLTNSRVGTVLDVREVGKLGFVGDEIQQNAEKHNVLDFDKRIKETVIERVLSNAQS